MTVKNKVVLITGAARGLGREYAVSLAGAGAKVVAGDVLDCAATVTVARAAVQATGGQAIGVSLDVTDMALRRARWRRGAGCLRPDRCAGEQRGAVRRAARWAVQRDRRSRLGRRHGGQRQGHLELLQGGGRGRCVPPAAGSIVNVASLAATYGMPYALHYTTSKAAVIGLTRGLARELGRDNIRVNALAPSAVLTEGTDEFLGEKRDRALDVIRAGQSIPRTLVPADLTGTVAWLISDASRFVTGQTIAVDGGTVLL